MGEPGIYEITMYTLTATGETSIDRLNVEIQGRGLNVQKGGYARVNEDDENKGEITAEVDRTEYQHHEEIGKRYEGGYIAHHLMIGYARVEDEGKTEKRKDQEEGSSRLYQM